MDSPPRTGSDTPLHFVVRISPPGAGGPSVEDGDVSESSDVNVPVDMIVISAGCREIVTETLDKLCMWRVSRMCWLNSFLFVFLSGWFAASRGQPVLADLHRYCWEPGGWAR